MAACLALAAAANAQDQPAASAQPAGAQQGQGSGAVKLDHNFLKQTAVDNQFEIQLSQLAQSNAQDEKVKQLAQTLVRDHTQATEQLKQVAQKKQVQLPTALPETKKEEIQIFQSLQGSEFDQAYLSCMKVSHAKSVAAYSEKSKNAKDQDVKQFASAILPKLKEHKQHVTAMTGGDDDAQTAGSKQQSGASGTSGTSGGSSGSSSGSGTGSGSGTSSSGSGSRETGSGTSTGGGTTGAGSTGSRSGGGSQ
jgi:putative membrane protein